MEKSTRRKFLQTASIFTGISVLNFTDVFAYIGNEKIPIGASSKALNDAQAIADYLSQLFGIPVTSDMDLDGYWTLSFNGGPPKRLTFQLNEVVITSSGKVINHISGNEVHGGPADWAPELLSAFAGGALIMGGPSSVFYRMLTYNVIPVTSGSDGISTVDAIGLANTTMGIAMGAGDVATFAAGAESSRFLSQGGYVMGILGIGGNLYEVFDGTPDTAAERLEDLGQAALGAILLGVGGPAGGILNGIILGPWEIYELKRKNP